MAAVAPDFWFRRGPAALLLLPLAGLFAALAWLRRRLIRPQRLPVPVVIVGNIAVGGSGKTPAVHWLVMQLRSAGFRPGIVSRGHGSSIEGVALLPATAEAARYGDEPVLLKQLCQCPVAIGRDRPAAARALLRQHPDCDVIVADDGMQHYRLGRTLEIAVLDPATLGNCFLLPAGPLREPVRRLGEVDLVLMHGVPSARLAARLGRTPSFPMRLRGDCLHAVDDPRRRMPLSALRGQRVHAVAGIGRPQRFFAQLAAAGLEVEPHPFPDHHRFSAADLDFGVPAPILMTAKDAVKCHSFAPGNCWVLPVEAELPEAAAIYIVEKLNHGRALA